MRDRKACFRIIPAGSRFIRPYSKEPCVCGLTRRKHEGAPLRHKGKVICDGKFKRPDYT